MVGKTLEWLMLSIGTAIDWFGDLLFSTGGTPIYLGAVFIWLVYKYILAPVVGGSDEANANRKKKGDEK